MLNSFRTGNRGKASTFFLWIIMALLAFGLAGYSLVGAAAGLAGQNVASVGDEKVSREDFERTMAISLNNASRQFGTQLTFSQARVFGLDRQVLGQLVTQAALEGEAKAFGISAGNDAVRDEIVARPQFGRGGNFDPDRYSYVLEQSGYTVPGYEESVRGDLSRSILEAGVIGGVRAPDMLVDALLAFQGEERRFRFAPVSLGDLPEPLGTPTEEDLAKFYEENPEAYTLPEARAVTYAALRIEDMAADIDISDDEIRDVYETQNSRFVQPERRVLDRIVFANEEEAKAAADAIEAGETDFDAVAEARGLAAEAYQLGQREAVQFPAAEAEQLFGETGIGIVGPITSNLGPALYRINAVIPGESVSYEEAAQDIRQELAVDIAADLVGEEIEAIEDLVASGATLEEIAEETPMTLGTIEVSERLGDGLGADSAFREEALAAEPGEERDLIDLSEGGIAVLRVEEVIAPRLQSRDEIDGSLADDWRIVAEQVAITDFARGLADGIREGRDFGIALSANGIVPQEVDFLTRAAPAPGIPPRLLEAVFAAEDGETDVVQDGGATFLFKIEEIKAFDQEAEDNSAAIDLIRAQIAETLSIDVLTGYAEGAQGAAGVSVNQSLIDQIFAANP